MIIWFKVSMVLLMIIWLVDFFLIKQFDVTLIVTSRRQLVDVTLIVTSRRQIVFSIFQFMMSLIEWEYMFLVNTDLKIKIMSNKIARKQFFRPESNVLLMIQYLWI